MDTQTDTVANYKEGGGKSTSTEHVEEENAQVVLINKQKKQERLLEQLVGRHRKG